MYDKTQIKVKLMHPTQELILKIHHERNVLDMKLSELGSLTGTKHLQQVKHHRDMLIKKGLLSSHGNTRQAFSQKDILKGKSELINIPILGSANVGIASIYADARVEGYLRISSEKLPIKYKQALYALKVIGNSMNKAQIGLDKLNLESQDYVIADGEQYDPKTGDYVVSLINGMANIKKLIINNDQQQIVLLSESEENHPPIILDINDQIDYLAQSKVLHVIKTAQYRTQ